jgi:hypothetical protein
VLIRSATGKGSPVARRADVWSWWQQSLEPNSFLDLGECWARLIAVTQVLVRDASQLLNLLILLAQTSAASN